MLSQFENSSDESLGKLLEVLPRDSFWHIGGSFVEVYLLINQGTMGGWEKPKRLKKRKGSMREEIPADAETQIDPNPKL